MTENFLHLNPEETELIVLGHQSLTDSLSEQSLVLDNITETPNSTVKIFGVLFDQELSFNAHIKQTCRTAYFHLKKKQKLETPCLEAMKNLSIHFFSSRLGYCNSLFAGCPKI